MSLENSEEKSPKNSEDNFVEIQCIYLYHIRHICSISSKKSFKYNPSVLRVFGVVVLVLVFLQFYCSTLGDQGYARQLMETTTLHVYPIDHDFNDTTTYYDFIDMMIDFEKLNPEDMPKYNKDTPICQLDHDILGPRTVNKTKVKLEWVEQHLPHVKPGGYHVPTHCRSRHKVAILVPFRNRETNLAIFLYHLHPFLKKQLLDYRIFVIEQFGTGKFNKGSLYNIGFLETQKYGDWHCLIFHDVDLLPTDERILYSCPRMPTHLSSSVESHGYQLAYLKLFGGVTAMTPAQFEAVNGYSNAYWNWGAEDDDMFVRLQAKRFPVLRYNISIGRFATLPHKPNSINDKRNYILSLAKRRFRREGLRSIEYRLINITTRKLFTHILADVNPHNTPV